MNRIHAPAGPEMQGQAADHAIVARLIGALDALGESPSLAAVAAQGGMTAAGLREVLERWSGTEAAECLRLLSRTHPARLLATRQATLAPLPDGRNGTATTFETAAADRRQRGAGLTIRWAVVDSPFGTALVMATGHGICAVGFIDGPGEEAALADLRTRWPAAGYPRDEDTIAPLAAAAFRAGGPPPPLHLIGAPFQLQVWEVLLRIPPGRVTTYSAIAGAIGRPLARRAVGTAVGRNPVSLLVPCHRVLRSEGATGGYHWGILRKRVMLARESAHVPVADAA